MDKKGKYWAGEMTCLSCNKWTKAKDLQNHVEEKVHLENVEKKSIL